MLWEHISSTWTLEAIYKVSRQDNSAVEWPRLFPLSSCWDLCLSSVKELRAFVQTVLCLEDPCLRALLFCSCLLLSWHGGYISGGKGPSAGGGWAAVRALCMRSALEQSLCLRTVSNRTNSLWNLDVSLKLVEWISGCLSVNLRSDAQWRWIWFLAAHLAIWHSGVEYAQPCRMPLLQPSMAKRPRQSWAPSAQQSWKFQRTLAHNALEAWGVRHVEACLSCEQALAGKKQDVWDHNEENLARTTSSPASSNMTRTWEKHDFSERFRFCLSELEQAHPPCPIENQPVRSRDPNVLPIQV